MKSILQIFLLVCALLFSYAVVRLLLKNRISERNSVIWLGGAIVIFLISGNTALFDHVARMLGIDYPPTLLFLLSTLVLLLFSLYQTIQITKLSSKIKDISQYLALNPKEEIQDNNEVTRVGNEHE